MRARAVSWVSENAILLLLLMAAALVAALIFAVLGFVAARNAQGDVNTLQASKRAEERATIRADYRQCRRSIPFTRAINGYLADVADDYRDRAGITRALAMLDPVGSEARRLRLATAAELQRKAAAVPHFPLGTIEKCAAARAEALGQVPPLDGAP